MSRRRERQMISTDDDITPIGFRHDISCSNSGFSELEQTKERKGRRERDEVLTYITHVIQREVSLRLCGRSLLPLKVPSPNYKSCHVTWDVYEIILRSLKKKKKRSRNSSELPKINLSRRRSRRGSYYSCPSHETCDRVTSTEETKTYERGLEFAKKKKTVLDI